MISRFIIDDLHAERFGGLTNTGLTLGSDGLVVIHGPNESGKTTLATLLAWLLVGPIGKASDALRFGRPGEQLSARLNARLNDDDIRIDGAFRLLQSRAPNTTGLVIQRAGEKLGLEAWRTMIGGIDPVVLTATYRMWGADLHDDHEVLAEVAQAATEGLGSSQRVSVLLAKVEQQAKELLSSQAAASESWAKLNSQYKTLDQEIRALSSNASEYRTHQAREHEVKALLQQYKADIVRLTNMASAIETLQSVTDERRKVNTLSEQLEALPVVPAEWMSIVGDVHGFRSAADAVNTTADTHQRATAALKAATVRAGVDDTEAQQLRVTHGTVTAVEVQLANLATARSNARDAEVAMAEASDLLADAKEQANRSIAACPEVTLADLEQRPLKEADVRTLRIAISEWATARGQVDKEEVALSKNQARLDTAWGTRDAAEARWERFGTGVGAQQWRVTPATTVPATTTTTVSRSWPALALAGAITLVAVLALPRWAAAGITLVAIAGAVVALRRTRQAPATPLIESPNPQANDELLLAANAVVAAQAGVDDAEQERRRLLAELNMLQLAVDSRRSAVADECTRLGLGMADTPATLENALDRALDASAAVESQTTAQQAFDTAVRAAERAQAKVTELLNTLATTLGDAGVPQRLPVEQAAAMIDMLREVTDLVAREHLAHEAAGDAFEAFTALTAPLGSEIAERSPTTLMAEAQRLASLQADRQRLIDERNMLRLTIDGRFSNQPAVKELSNQRRTDEEWALELEQAKADLEHATAQRDQLNQELGELAETMRQLSNSDELAGMRLQAGSVLERADEQLLAGVTRAAAAALLARLATERRRTHQPGLVARASQLLTSVATDWTQLLVDPADDGSAEVTVVGADGSELAASRLSTGARALMHLSLRLATAELDSVKRGVRFPIICDDPLVHLDDERAQAVMPLLAQAARDGHQVIVFTCHGRTVDAARAVGAQVVQMP
jgi:uncharacterized protein YhaN